MGFDKNGNPTKPNGCRVDQYLPAYVDPINVERERSAAETREALEALPFVARWKDDPGFHRFSVSTHRGGRANWDWDGTVPSMLMAELDGGKNWWVVAQLEDPERYGLPEWEAK